LLKEIIAQFEGIPTWDKAKGKLNEIENTIPKK